MKNKCSEFLRIFPFLLMLAGVVFAQEKNPTIYPYGGTFDNSRKYGDKTPLNFKTANFMSSEFDNIIDFNYSHFEKPAEFLRAKFKLKANFENTVFKQYADFSLSKFEHEIYFNFARFERFGEFVDTRFNDRAEFTGTNFNIVLFLRTHFEDEAFFWTAHFDSLVRYWLVFFKGKANFGGSEFNTEADFKESYFLKEAFFQGVKFNYKATFKNTSFDSIADFSFANFKNIVDFRSAVFNSKIDFRNAVFNDSAEIDFSLSEIKNHIFIGKKNSTELQKFDFMRTILLKAGEKVTKAYKLGLGNGSNIYFPERMIKYPGAKIILFGPVNLKIQIEKFKFISLYDSLDYYAKKDIISILKQVSFKGDEYSKERFELDYIFDKSTMYQKQSPNYENYSALNPICWWRFLYNVTMGLGYRPFRLALWVLGFIIIFTIIYFLWIPQQVNRYIIKEYDKKDSSNSRRKRIVRKNESIYKANTFINCLYFSSMQFFTIRFKRDILAFFDKKETRVIVSEYFIGLLIYIAFLTLSKSGSILHTLKSLFVG